MKTPIARTQCIVSAMNRMSVIAALIALALCACRDSSTRLFEPGDPLLVRTSTLPAENDRVYYKIWCEGVDVVPLAKDELRELVRHKLPIRAAWFPATCSPCECATCVAAITIELSNPENAILAHGYIETTEQYVVNCGVPNMWRFDVISAAP